MNIPLLDLKRQYQRIKEELEPELLACLAGGVYIKGPRVAEFEREVAGYVGAGHAVSTGNGTDALVIALKAFGVKAGDEVITTPFSFFATAEAVAVCGAKPVFADIDEKTFNIDPAKIEEKITDKTKAILPVDIFGQPADIDAVTTVARKHGLAVIEDACQAMGSEYNGRKTGSGADAVCFSFFPTKNLGCFGDGGMITTNDEKIAVKCRALREHGSGKNGRDARAVDEGTYRFEAAETENAQYNPYKYYNYIVGGNSRLDEIQAAILLVKLRHLEEWNAARAKNAAFYKKELARCGVVLPFEAPGARHIWNQFALRCQNKSGLIAHLKEKGISAGVFYPVPLHLQKAFDSLGFREGDCPVAEKICSQTVCLPVFPELTGEELSFIVSAVKEYAGV